MAPSRVAAVLGAGNGGQGMAAYLVRKGYAVRLWNRPDAGEVRAWLDPIRAAGSVDLVGWQPGRLPVEVATTELAEAVGGASLVALVTTADAHRAMARALAPRLGPGQLVLLVPGRTGGALDFRAGLAEAGRDTREILVAETNTTVVNSRVVGPGRVEVLGEKRGLPLAALPAADTAPVLERLAGLPFVAAPSVLSTGLTNFGVPLHAVPMVLNAGWLEDRPGAFLYYQQGISPAVARAVARADAERLALAAALGVPTTALGRYLVESLGAPAGDLYASIHGCEMYRTVPAPPALDHRYLWEDVVAGVVPMVSLGEAVGCPLPVLQAVLTLAGALLGRDLAAQGRTVERLGLAGLDAAGIRRRVTEYR
jgi:opine dehydrogenase